MLDITVTTVNTQHQGVVIDQTLYKNLGKTGRFKIKGVSEPVLLYAGESISVDKKRILR